MAVEWEGSYTICRGLGGNTDYCGRVEEQRLTMDCWGEERVSSKAQGNLGHSGGWDHAWAGLGDEGGRGGEMCWQTLGRFH